MIGRLHGGEPTLLGVDFFRRVVELQAPYRARKEIRNTLQTNALSLDDEWCAFFKANDFFIGVSLDGPQDIHDRYARIATVRARSSASWPACGCCRSTRSN